MSLRGAPWEWGQAAEKAVRQKHVNAGHFVIPTSAIETGGAPKVIGLLQKFTLPDLQVYENRAPYWVEVKFKDHADFFQKRCQWQHGIDLPHWKDYLKVETETGIRGQLDIIQYKPGRLADPKPVLLWQSFQELQKYVQILAQPHHSFRKGAAYWPIGAFKCSPIDFVPPPNIPSVSKNINPWEQLSMSGEAPQMPIEYCEDSPFERRKPPPPPRQFKKPPDLQKLVEKYGGYDRITPQAWAEYDMDVKTWRSEYLATR